VLCAWFDHPEESFSDKEVQVKGFSACKNQLFSG